MRSQHSVFGLLSVLVNNVCGLHAQSLEHPSEKNNKIINDTGDRILQATSSIPEWEIWPETSGEHDSQKQQVNPIAPSHVLRDQDKPMAKLEDAAAHDRSSRLAAMTSDRMLLQEMSEEKDEEGGKEEEKEEGEEEEEEEKEHNARKLHRTLKRVRKELRKCKSKTCEGGSTAAAAAAAAAAVATAMSAPAHTPTITQPATTPGAGADRTVNVNLTVNVNATAEGGNADATAIAPVASPVIVVGGGVAGAAADGGGAIPTLQPTPAPTYTPMDWSYQDPFVERYNQKGCSTYNLTSKETYYKHCEIGDYCNFNDRPSFNEVIHPADCKTDICFDTCYLIKFEYGSSGNLQMTTYKPYRQTSFLCTRNMFHRRQDSYFHDGHDCKTDMTNPYKGFWGDSEKQNLAGREPMSCVTVYEYYSTYSNQMYGTYVNTNARWPACIPDFI